VSDDGETNLLFEIAQLGAAIRRLHAAEPDRHARGPSIYLHRGVRRVRQITFADAAVGRILEVGGVRALRITASVGRHGRSINGVIHLFASTTCIWRVTCPRIDSRVLDPVIDRRSVCRRVVVRGGLSRIVSDVRFVVDRRVVDQIVGRLDLVVGDIVRRSLIGAGFWSHRRVWSAIVALTSIIARTREQRRT
jgi:hypothetical protein